MANSFFDLPYVKKVVAEMKEEEKKELQVMNIIAVHGDHVAELPKEAVLHGSSLST